MNSNDSLIRLIQNLTNNSQDDTDPNNVVIQQFQSPYEEFQFGENVTTTKWDNQPQWCGDTSATFSRNSSATNVDGSYVGNNLPRFTTGKFGQGMFIEEGTTNFIANSSAIVPNGSNPANWSVTIVSGSATATWENGGFQGKCLHIICPTSSDRALWQNTSLYSAKANQVYTLSAWLNTNATGSFIQIQETITGPTYANHIANYTGKTKTDSNGVKWYEVAVTFTTNANFTGWTWGVRADNSSSKAIDYKACDIQLEEKSYVTSYLRNDSTTTSATRVSETVAIPTVGALNPSMGTIEFSCNFLNVTKYQIIMYEDTGTQNGFFINITSGKIGFGVGDGTSTQTIQATTPFQVNTWHKIAASWNTLGTSLYIDGVKIGTLAFTPKPNFVTNFQIGYNTDTYNTDMVIDDFRISSIVRSDSDISTAYNNGQPFPVDKYTTYKLSFDGNLFNTAYANQSFNWNQGGRYAQRLEVFKCLMLI